MVFLGVTFSDTKTLLLLLLLFWLILLESITGNLSGILSPKLASVTRCATTMNSDKLSVSLF